MAIARILSGLILDMDGVLANTEPLQARAWVDAADPGEEQGFDDLQRVMHRLWIARLGEEARQLAATGATGAEDRERLRALHEQITRLKAGLAAPAA